MTKGKTIGSCLLCKATSKMFYKNKGKQYYKCENCSALMLDSSNYLSREEEKNRYKTHNNDIHDVRYQNFVSPIVESVKASYQTKHIGLDYGAGTGPVITSLLEKEGYQLKLYDPYFHNYPENLLKKYDYIICCEVIEHFHKPYEEFKRLSNMLKPGGTIFSMTEIYDDGIDFETWYYKNDDTHVFFYHEKSLEWIKNEFAFAQLKIEGRLIRLKKP